MRLTSKSLVALLVSITTQSSSTVAFTAISPRSRAAKTTATFYNNKRTFTSLYNANGAGTGEGGSEFDYLLGEGMNIQSHPHQTQNALSSKISASSSSTIVDTKNIIILPDTSAAATATLTSSVTYDEVASTTEGGDVSAEASAEVDDIFGDGAQSSPSTSSAATQQQLKDPRLAELIRTNEKRAAMKLQPSSRPPLKTQVQNFLKGKDFGEIFFTVLIPVIGGYYLTKEAYARVSDRVGTKAEETLEDYANEMIYHDGDFDEMKLAHQDYSKKLAFLGPKKGDTMIKKYLEYYAKKKTVSPQAIR